MDFSPITAGSIGITAAYTLLLLWGMFVGVRQVYQGFRRPQDLLNPLFGNRQAIKIFTFHLLVVSTICLCAGRCRCITRAGCGIGVGALR